jgi:hypothetical protein
LIAIVDAGPLYAVVDDDDVDHDRCMAVLQRRDLDFMVPTLIAAEVSYLVGKRLGAEAEAEFLRNLTALEIEGPRKEDWGRIADLVRRYSDFPLGGADASVVVLAERLGTDLLVSLDERHFRAITLPGRRPFRILPE